MAADVRRMSVPPLRREWRVTVFCSQGWHCELDVSHRFEEPRRWPGPWENSTDFRPTYRWLILLDAEPIRTSDIRGSAPLPCSDLLPVGLIPPPTRLRPLRQRRGLVVFLLAVVAEPWAPTSCPPSAQPRPETQRGSP